MAVGVLLQACVVVESLVAVVTLVRPLFVVYKHVALQSISTCECTCTFRALKRFLTSVSALVRTQVGMPLESFAAKLAGVL